MPWPHRAAGTSVWVKVMTPGVKPIVGDGGVIAGAHLEALLGLVVADGVGHAGLECSKEV